MGSAKNSVACYDCTSQTNVNIMTITNGLKAHVRPLVMMESLLPLCYASFLFALKKTTEPLHISQFQQKIETVDQRYVDQRPPFI